MVISKEGGAHIYIYTFSRRSYPKRLTVHSGYTFCLYDKIPDTSWVCQNECINLMSSSIIRTIKDEIRSLPVLQYSIIMDGTRDISGVEQEALCLHYVDTGLLVHKDFIGLYETTSTTGENLARIILDVLLRLNLPVSGLRGQAYDGASNMAGKYSGAQAVIQRAQPLAPYIHCGAHCVNLITQQACSASSLVRNALDWKHDLGNLVSWKTSLKPLLQLKERASPVYQAFMSH